MAKKKTSKESVSYLEGYIPAGFTPTTSAQEIIQIPPYPDVGVKFAGYSKTARSQGYEINPQIRRTQTGTITGAVTTSITGTRLDPKLKFYAGNLHIDCSTTNGGITLTIHDGATSAGRERARCVLSAGIQHFDIDFSNSPRDFITESLTFVLSGVMGGASDFLSATLIGWAE